jgi:YfiH family protein
MTGNIEYQIFRDDPNILCQSLWRNLDLDQSRETDGSKNIPGSELLKKSLFTADSLVSAKQMHGKDVEQIKNPGIVNQCDGLITTLQKLPLLIRTADCASVMIYSPEQKSIANLHVGWRGALAGIIATGLEKLSRPQAGSVNSMKVAISPLIRGCCYEVGEEFYDTFDKKYLERNDEKIFFHLERIIADQLLEAGILSRHIDFSSECTHCSPLELPSYRRNKTCNRMLNVIEIKEI